MGNEAVGEMLTPLAADKGAYGRGAA